MDENSRNRLAKAIHIKRSLKDMGVTEENCPGLEEFSKILNDWVRNDEWAKGKVKLYEIDKKLVYDLQKPQYTMVKLTDI